MRTHFLVILIFWAICVCSRSYAEQLDCSDYPLIPNSLIAAAELEEVWQNNLPIKSAEKLIGIFIVYDKVFYLTDWNYLMCLDADTGGMIYGAQLAAPGFALDRLGFFRGTMFTVTGGRIMEYDLDTGILLREGPTPSNADCFIDRNSEYFYAGGLEGRLNVLRPDDKASVFHVYAPNPAPIASIIANDESVIFGTRAGTVISMKADEPLARWRFELGRELRSPLVADPPNLYLASTDAAIYSLQLKDGDVNWRYVTSSFLDRHPWITEDYLYQYGNRDGVICLDKDAGTFVWRVEDGLGFLAEDGYRSYVFAEPGKLVVMDNVKGRELFSVNIGSISKFASNTVGNKLILSDDKGRTICLRPVY